MENPVAQSDEEGWMFQIWGPKDLVRNLGDVNHRWLELVVLRDNLPHDGPRDVAGATLACKAGFNLLTNAIGNPASHRTTNNQRHKILQKELHVLSKKGADTSELLAHSPF